jgi:RNA polymerase sigma-70 factor (ECF subfamily)
MARADQTRRLVREAQAGDRAAFDELAARFRERVERFVRSQLGVRVHQTFEVEDILQETWLRAFQSLGAFEWRDEESFVHWLCVIAENNIRHAARQVRHGPTAPLTDDPRGEEASGGTSLRRDERFDRLQAALDELDADSRKVIVLARIEGLPIKEVAKRMGRSPNATSILLYRAAIKLKERFGDTESLSLPLRRLVDRGSTDES